MGIACCKAMVTPTPWGREGYKALMSGVASIRDFLSSVGTCSCSVMWITSVDDETPVGSLSSICCDNFWVGPEQQLTMGLSW